MPGKDDVEYFSFFYVVCHYIVFSLIHQFFSSSNFTFIFESSTPAESLFVFLYDPCKS